MCAAFQRNYTVYVNKVPVADADLMATNGVVHAVNSIVKPLRESHIKTSDSRVAAVTSVLRWAAGREYENLLLQVRSGSVKSPHGPKH